MNSPIESALRLAVAEKLQYLSEKHQLNMIPLLISAAGFGLTTYLAIHQLLQGASGNPETEKEILARFYPFIYPVTFAALGWFLYQHRIISKGLKEVRQAIRDNRYEADAEIIETALDEGLPLSVSSNDYGGVRLQFQEEGPAFEITPQALAQLVLTRIPKDRVTYGSEK